MLGFGGATMPCRNGAQSPHDARVEASNDESGHGAIMMARERFVSALQPLVE